MKLIKTYSLWESPPLKLLRMWGFLCRLHPLLHPTHKNRGEWDQVICVAKCYWKSVSYRRLQLEVLQVRELCAVWCFLIWSRRGPCRPLVHCSVKSYKIIVNKNPTDPTVCRYLLTAKLLYMFRVSQHPSSGVLKTLPAASGTGHNTCTVTSLHLKHVE